MWAAALPALALPIARRLAQGVFAHDPSPVYNKFLAMAAALQLLFGLALAIGLWLR
jgi:1,4-dihydroxy-2-naphthoate octaprenyltransferase